MLNNSNHPHIQKRVHGVGDILRLRRDPVSHITGRDSVSALEEP